VLIPDLLWLNSTMLHSKNLENITRLTVKGHMTEMVPGALASFQSLRTLILDENAYFSDSRLGRKEQRRLHMSSSLKRNI
jgi:hypothetical protein